MQEDAERIWKFFLLFLFITCFLPFPKKEFPPKRRMPFPILCRKGTGAGFPGMPLAIACPGLEVTLLEAQGKRCRFLEAVQSALELTNVQVIQERAEVLGRAEGHREGYDRAVARAVAPLNVLCEYLLPFVRTGGLALCWKGPAVFEEMEDGKSAALQVGGSVEEPIETALEERRHVVVPIRKMEKTLPQFPRKNGIPVKRPLKSGK